MLRAEFSIKYKCLRCDEIFQERLRLLFACSPRWALGTKVIFRIVLPFCAAPFGPEYIDYTEIKMANEESRAVIRYVL